MALGALYRQIFAKKKQKKKGERKGCFHWVLAKETDTKMASTVALQVHITGKTTGFPHLVLLHLTLFALRVGFAGGWLTKKRPPKKSETKTVAFVGPFTVTGLVGAGLALGLVRRGSLGG